MELIVLGSSSLGNCYILKSESDVLIIEAGVRFSKVQEALDYQTVDIVGCLATHEDGDHIKYYSQVIDGGVRMFTSKGTLEKIKVTRPWMHEIIESGKKCLIGDFTVVPFDVIHDAAEPLGFYISHPEMGNLVFITDSKYSKYTFPNVNHFLVEANYVDHVIARNVDEGRLNESLANRILQSHMGFDTCLNLLEANDLKQVRNIILLHLSNGNSDEKYMVDKVVEKTGKQTFAAITGLRLSLNINTF